MNEKQKQIRVGLLLDSYTLPAWVDKMIDEINQIENCAIVLIVKNQKVEKSAARKLSNNFSKLLYHFYTRLDQKIFHCELDAFAPVDCSQKLEAVDKIEVAPIRKIFSDSFNDEDIEAIRKYKIDLFIRLGFRILRGEILNLANYGIWSYHHGDNRINRGGPAGFWEVFENHPTTGSVLQILREDLDNGIVLYRSYSTTEPYSVSQNRNKIYWKTLRFIPRMIKRLVLLGEERFFEEVKANQDTLNTYSQPLYTFPNNYKMFKLLCQKIWLVGKKIFERAFYFNQWFLMFNYQKDMSQTFYRFKKILPHKDRYWADPHIVRHNNRYFIFIEEVPHKTNKGHIALIEMDRKGNYTQPQKILEQPYHLSYPFVFDYKGDYYMIPESLQNRTIELYKAIKFPHQWKLEKILFDGISAVDATVLFHESRWWLFANVAEIKGSSTMDELHLFYTDDLLKGIWQAHQNNPVISDCRSSRPAGRIFNYRSKIIRPSQNSSGRYGYGFCFNRIMKLTPEEYREQIISSVDPDWSDKIVATHTFAYDSGLTVIDGMYKRRRFL